MHTFCFNTRRTSGVHFDFLPFPPFHSTSSFLQANSLEGKQLEVQVGLQCFWLEFGGTCVADHNRGFCKNPTRHMIRIRQIISAVVAPISTWKLDDALFWVAQLPRNILKERRGRGLPYCSKSPGRHRSIFKRSAWVMAWVRVWRLLIMILPQWFMVYHGLSWFIMVYHSLSSFCGKYLTYLTMISMISEALWSLWSPSAVRTFQVNDLERELPSIRDEMSLMREQAAGWMAQVAPQPIGQRGHTHTYIYMYHII